MAAQKGPYLRAHNKLSLSLDRILPQIAAVEASTLELMTPGSAMGSLAGFKESEQAQVIARAAGRSRSAVPYLPHSQCLWLDVPPRMRAPPRIIAKPQASADGDAEDDGPGGVSHSSSNLSLDFRTLASASRRANNPAAEGNANFCMSVLQDNKGNHVKAAQHLQLFLQASRATGDVGNQALALNALGVNLYFRGNLEQAMSHHRQHLDLAQENLSQFVAYTNLGVTAAAQGLHEEALSHFEGALRCAVQAGSVAAESCATANLGCAAMHSSDFDNAQALFERYLQLTKLLKDKQGNGDAVMFLGKLATARSDFDSASEYYSQAMQLSTTTKQEATTNAAKCSFGIASGTMALSAHMDELRRSLREAESSK